MSRDDPLPHLFLCNGAALSTRRAAWRKADPVDLNTDPRGGNIEVRIRDISKALATTLPPLAADLIEIAATVYIADQLAQRTGRKTAEYGDLWYRTMRIECAVREPDFWSQDRITECLVQTLGFVSGDNIEFGFSRNPSPTPAGDYLAFRLTDPNPEGIQHATLFSGGLDSLAGAVHQVFEQQQRVALVSHKPVGHVAGLQRSLIDALSGLATDRAPSPLPISVWAHKRGLVEKDHTQRTRSFLYVALGSVVARIFGLKEVGFFENGVVSINLPLTGHEFGGRATRTTHPQTLALYRRLLSGVFETDFGIRNDFLWKSKQDIVEIIERAGFGSLIAKTVSCMHTRETTRSSPHCGLCSQCLSRRFATLGVGGDIWDPAILYRSDVMTAERTKTTDRTITERFIGIAREIEAMNGATQFQRRFAVELARITPFLLDSAIPRSEDSAPAPIGTSTVIEHVYDLHRRHADQIGAVLTDAMKLYAEAIRRDELPDSCPVSLAYRKTSGKSGGGPSIATTSHDTQPPNCFVPTKEQLLVLQILASSATRLVQVEIEAATRQHGLPMSRKTIGQILRVLLEHQLIEFSAGPRKGASILEAGRRLLEKNADSH